MSINRIGNSGCNSEEISDQLEQVSLNSIRNILPDKMIEQTCKEVGYNFRKRKITPIVTVLHMVMAAIWPEESFNACWQVLWDSFISRFPQLSGQCPSRGRVAEARVLDRLILYERRIENSMLRMLKEFKKQQVMRIIIQQDMNQQIELPPSLRDRITNAGKNINSKKQSQFPPDMMGVNPFGQGGYGDFPPAGIDENKANQSQFQGHSGLNPSQGIRCPSDT